MKPLTVSADPLLRVLDTLYLNGPLTFSEICASAQVTSLPINTSLYTEDQLGPPYNRERMSGILYRLTKLGMKLIIQVRSDQWRHQGNIGLFYGRQLPEQDPTVFPLKARYRRLVGDPHGYESEPEGSVCTVTAHKDGMVWYRYDNQKKRWGRCSKVLCMRPGEFLVTFSEVEG